MAQHATFIVFLFLLGACLGSFLNVVVWRLPRGQSLVRPPSHCPKCEHRLAWYDNIPILGWVLLKGKCRYCGQGISIRYPIVELITALLFVFYYVMFFIVHVGPCAPLSMQDAFGNVVHLMPLSLESEWPMYFLYMLLVCALVAVTLIDAELFIIDMEIVWVILGAGVIVHALIDRPTVPGALNLVNATGMPTDANALAAGGAAGLLISVALLLWGWMPGSFSAGEPSLEIDKVQYEEEVAAAKKEGREPPPEPITMTGRELRAEMRKEMLFLLPPLTCAIAWWVLTQRVPGIKTMWHVAVHPAWVNGMLGAMLGAMVGGLVVWVIRILGTYALGRVAMGMGDVHLMFGVGAIIGAGAATIAFFLSPFPGALVGLWGLLTRKRHELPLGPYLSLATLCVILFYCPIADYLRPGFEGLGIAMQPALRALGL